MLTTSLTKPRMLAAVLLAALIAGCGSSGSGSGSSAANATDKAFVVEMIPHHQLALEMAKQAQAQAQRPQVKSLAGNITSSQSAEIAQMTGIAKTLGVKPASMNPSAMTAMQKHAATLGIRMDQMGMDMKMSSLDGAKPFDRAFLDMMTPHHEGAVNMARAEIAKGKNPKLRALAKTITADQTKEIGEMKDWRTKWYGKPAPGGGMGTSGG